MEIQRAYDGALASGASKDEAQKAEEAAFRGEGNRPTLSLYESLTNRQWKASEVLCAAEMPKEVMLGASRPDDYEERYEGVGPEGGRPSAMGLNRFDLSAAASAAMNAPQEVRGHFSEAKLPAFDGLRWAWAAKAVADGPADTAAANDLLRSARRDLKAEDPVLLAAAKDVLRGAKPSSPSLLALEGLASAVSAPLADAAAGFAPKEGAAPPKSAKAFHPRPKDGPQRS